MNEIALLNHIDKFITIKFRDLLYCYDRKAKQFKSKCGQKMSLDFALLHSDEVTPGWETERKFELSADISIDRDCGVITSFMGSTIVDVKTQAHL